MGFERGIIDKMINGAFLGKREIGRPLKYNTRNRGRHGYVDTSFTLILYFFLFICYQMDRVAFQSKKQN